MIQPVSCCKPRLNFKGVENNNFKGANALSQGSTGMLLEGRNTRDDYNTTLKNVSNLHDQFTADAGAKFDRTI